MRYVEDFEVPKKETVAGVQAIPFMRSEPLAADARMSRSWIGVGVLLGAAVMGAAPQRGPEAEYSAQGGRIGGGLADAPAADLEAGGGVSEERIREGTELLNEVGCFRLAGERVIFSVQDGKRHFVGLENLTLERVARIVADSPDRLQWVITGTVTEFRGSSYVLIRRAILKGRAPLTPSAVEPNKKGVVRETPRASAQVPRGELGREPRS